MGTRMRSQAIVLGQRPCLNFWFILLLNSRGWDSKLEAQEMDGQIGQPDVGLEEKGFFCRGG